MMHIIFNNFILSFFPFFALSNIVIGHQVKGQLPGRRKLADDSPQHEGKCLPVVFGRMVDAVLQQLLDFALRDYLAHFLQGLCANPEQVTQFLKYAHAIKNVCLETLCNLMSYISRQSQITRIQENSLNLN